MNDRYEDFKTLRRKRQNARLRRENPDWRKEAGGGKGLYKRLAAAREAAQSDPRVATRLAALTQKAQAFQANRSELLGSGKPKTSPPSLPPHAVTYNSRNPVKGGQMKPQFVGQSGVPPHKPAKRRPLRYVR